MFVIEVVEFSIIGVYRPLVYISKIAFWVSFKFNMGP